MTRAVLSLLLIALCTAVGLVTTRVQSENHTKAWRLDHVKRRCDLVDAGNERLEAAVLARRYRLEGIRPERAPEVPSR